METRGHRRPGGPQLNSEINVTPLVDVMLVLLIIFIVVTPLIHERAAVELPHASRVDDVFEIEGQTLTVVLADDGTMLLETEPIAPRDLGRALRLRRGDDPRLHLRLAADRRVGYGEVKQVLEAGRAAGFRGVALIAREAGAAGAEGSGADPARPDRGD
ncbi:MAG: biopolymer transporter ExbD [Candidatus Eisenbacteria bacterium]|uniref:Biopolymer transporter ExbD n=1 Tax=Eiseniibacteriota bacterium TaxID=2212470 RepID=A0A938BQ53_UNCEI|nr:biopolymer transporter ExbD [Candidatus Eisenbacteria bacterium]